MTLHVNINRLKQFTYRDFDREIEDMKKCSTARELLERFPRTYHNNFNYIFGNDLIRKNIKNILFESEQFYDGFTQSLILNRFLPNLW